MFKLLKAFKDDLRRRSMVRQFSKDVSSAYLRFGELCDLRDEVHLSAVRETKAAYRILRDNYLLMHEQGGLLSLHRSDCDCGPCHAAQESVADCRVMRRVGMHWADRESQIELELIHLYRDVSRDYQRMLSKLPNLEELLAQECGQEQLERLLDLLEAGDRFESVVYARASIPGLA